jgi:hypothetical protein
MSKFECECPFCPLIEYDLQVCDVKVDLSKNHDVCYKDVKNESLPSFIRHNMLLIVLFCKNNHKLPVGKYMGDSDEEKCWEVGHLEQNVFEICFHAKKKNTDSDPIDTTAC